MKKVDYVALGERAKEIRKKHYRITQTEAARRVGCSVSFYGHLERGTRKASIQTLFSVSQVLGVSTDYLLYGYDIHQKEGERPIIVLPENPFFYSLVKVIADHETDWKHEPK